MPGVEVTWEKIKQTNNMMLSYALNQKYSYILDAGNNLRHLRNVKKNSPYFSGDFYVLLII